MKEFRALRIALLKTSKTLLHGDERASGEKCSQVTSNIQYNAFSRYRDMKNGCTRAHCRVQMELHHDNRKTHS